MSGGYNMSDLASMLRGDSEPDEVEEGPASLEPDPVEDVADADGEESSADDEEPEPEGEVEEGSEDPETEESPEDGEVESADAGETDPGAEAGDESETLAALRAEVELVKQREAKLLSLLERQQAPEPVQPVAGQYDQQAIARLREVTSGLKAVWNAEADKASEALSRLSPQTRDEVLASQRRFQDLTALLAADPSAFVQAVVLPALQPHLSAALEPVVAPLQRNHQEVALRDFAARHPDLSGVPEHWRKVATLVVDEGMPPERAAQLVRFEVNQAKTNQAKAKVDQQQRQQRALTNSRKAQATRKPNATGKPKPDFRGATSLGDFMAAEERTKRLSS